MTITCDPCTWPDVAMAFVVVLYLARMVTWGRRK